MTLQFDATEADLALFLDEAADQLRMLSDGLLRLEREASDPHELAGQGPITAPAEKPERTRQEKAAATAGRSEGTVTVEVEVAIEPRSEWSAVRAYQALMELAAAGTVVRSWPSEDKLPTGAGGHSLRVILTTDREPQVLRAAVSGVSETVAVRVPPLAEPEQIADARHADIRIADQGPEAGGSPVDRRRVDLGVEMRGAGLQEQHTTAGSRLHVAQRMVKVEIARLDELMNLAGELVIDRGRLLRVLRELSGRVGSDAALDHLAEITRHLARVSDGLQEQVMLSRLLPAETVFNCFPRRVRDSAVRKGLVPAEAAGLRATISPPALLAGRPGIIISTVNIRRFVIPLHTVIGDLVLHAAIELASALPGGDTHWNGHVVAPSPLVRQDGRVSYIPRALNPSNAYQMHTASPSRTTPSA